MYQDHILPASMNNGGWAFIKLHSLLELFKFQMRRKWFHKLHLLTWHFILLNIGYLDVCIRTWLLILMIHLLYLLYGNNKFIISFTSTFIQFIDRWFMILKYISTICQDSIQILILNDKIDIAKVNRLFYSLFGLETNKIIRFCTWRW